MIAFFLFCSVCEQCEGPETSKKKEEEEQEEFTGIPEPRHLAAGLRLENKTRALAVVRAASTSFFFFFFFCKAASRW